MSHKICVYLDQHFYINKRKIKNKMVAGVDMGNHCFHIICNAAHVESELYRISRDSGEPTAGRLIAMSAEEMTYFPSSMIELH